MKKAEVTCGLSNRLRLYIALIGIGSMALLAYLVQSVVWEPSTLGEMGLFIFLIVVAGIFPLSVTSGVKADLTTAVLVGAALLLEPGVAVVAAVVGRLTSYLIVRFWGDRLHLPGYVYPLYKYPFNLGETALTVGLASLVFHTLASDGGVLTLAVAPAVVSMYIVNTALVSGAVGLQLGLNPMRVWWMGTKENGLAELALFAFGFSGRWYTLRMPGALWPYSYL